MSYIIEDQVRHYRGLSSDILPEDEGEGMTAYEVNTGLQYVYHNGHWYEDLRLIYAFSQALNGGK